MTIITLTKEEGVVLRDRHQILVDGVVWDVPGHTMMLLLLKGQVEQLSARIQSIEIERSSS